MANGVRFRKAALSWRKCRDGNADDEGHGFRSRACRTGLWLEPAKLRSDIRLKAFRLLPDDLVDPDAAAAQRAQDQPQIPEKTLLPDILRVDLREPACIRHVDAVDLSEPGDAGPYFKYAQLPAGLDELALGRQARTGTDQTHIA